MALTVKNVEVRLLSYTGNTLLATWDWSKSSTESYLVKWEYRTELVDKWIGSPTPTTITVDEDSPASSRMSTYSIDSDAIKVRFSVKPVAKPKEGTKTYPWEASWSTAVEYDVKTNPPLTPSTPSFQFTTNSEGNYVLEAVLENLSLNATNIHFQVLKRDPTSKGLEVYKTSDTAIQYSTDEDKNNRINGYARYTCYAEDNAEYYVRARSARDSLTSEWSDYSSTPVYSLPTAPTEILEVRAESETSVYIEWAEVLTAEKYDVEYVTELKYFDTPGQSTTTSTSERTPRLIISGLESGKTYYFRVRSVRGSLVSDWTEPESVIVGKKPGTPLTWSSAESIVTGESLIFYWVHNSEDNSKQTAAKLELTIGGTITEIDVVIDNEKEEVERIQSYTFDTSSLSQGTTILWRVCTKGAYPGDPNAEGDYAGYGEWSIQRIIEVYAPPHTTLSVTDVDKNEIDTLVTFPIYVNASPGPVSQAPLSYHLSLTANHAYDTTDAVGNFRRITAGEEIFSRHYDQSSKLSVKLSAGDMILENNIEYTLTCTVAMNSGFTASASTTFVTAWAEDDYVVNAEVTVDTDSYTTAILPYCTTEYGRYVDGYTLTVYRRNYDGSLTKIMGGITNGSGTHATDPHPALDYARYRIVATSNKTGRMIFSDLPGIQVGGTEIVVQWAEKWSNFDNPDSTFPSEPEWAGSILRLPYNIDIQESTNPDVSRVEYTGRQHPVTYYGTQLGESASWSTVIDKNDVETLYALRRLARWMGDVYVREPSGSGYWANITVSISQTHGELTIPVTLNVTRVEGGV